MGSEPEDFEEQVMAADPTMIQILGELRNSNQGLLQALEQQRQQLDEQRRKQEADTAALQQALERCTSRSEGVVDVKQVGKPDTLKGTNEAIQDAWTMWAYTFTTWFCSQFARGAEVLEWAGASDDMKLTEERIAERARQTQNPDMRRINAQLHVALVSLCRDEALTVVKNSEKSQGCDAWRRLHRAYEPNNPQANLRLLRKIIQPAQSSLEHLRQAVETWEASYRTYRERTLEDLPDSVRRLAIRAMCPTSLQEHLDFHSARLNTYDLTKSEVVSYLDVKYAPQGDGAVPMDVDALKGKGKGSRGKKGKGKGRGSQNGQGNQTKPCSHCGKKGQHTEWDCWFNPRNKSPEAVAKRKAAAQKGEGKGKKDKGQGKSVASLDGQEWPAERSAQQNQDETVSFLFSLSPERGGGSRHRKRGPSRPRPGGNAKGAKKKDVRHGGGLSRSPPGLPEKTPPGAAGPSRPQPRESDAAKQSWSHGSGPPCDEAEGSSRPRPENAQELKPKPTRSTSTGVEMTLQHALAGKLSEKARAARAAGAVEEAEKFKSEARQLNESRLELARGRETKGDARLRQDIASGKPIALSIRKFKSRQRAARRRWRSQPERAEQRLDKERAWHAEFDNPADEQAAHLEYEDAYGGKFEGDRADLQPCMVRKPLSRSEKKAHCEEDEELEPVRVRSWDPPAWRKRRTKHAKKRHQAKEDDRRKRKGTWMSRSARRAVKATASAKSAARPAGTEASEAASSSTTAPVLPPWVVKATLKAKSAAKPPGTAADRGVCGADVPVERETLTPKTPMRPSIPPKATPELPPWRRRENPRPQQQTETEFAELMFLGGDEVLSLDRGMGWRRIDVTVDSGSATSCLPAHEVPAGLTLEPADGPAKYLSASDHAVHVKGQVTPVCKFQNQVEGRIKFKVLEPLKKPLFSTSSLVKAGYRVVHDEKSYIECKKTGAQFRIYERGGVYVIPTWMRDFPWQAQP